MLLIVAEGAVRWAALLENIGNAALTLTVPVSGDNPSISANFTLDSSSAGTCPLVLIGGTAGSLAAGGNCSLPVSFTPTIGGSITGQLTLTDNNLNANPSAMQSITLSGTATGASLTAKQTIASTSLTVYLPAASFSPVTGSGGTAPLSYSVAPALPAGLSLNSTTGAITGTPTVATSATNYTVTVTDANGAAATAAFSLTVNQATPNVTVSPNPTSLATMQSLTVSIAVSSGSGNSAPTSSVTLSSGSYSSASTTLTSGSATITVPAGSLATGTDTLTASYTGDGNNRPATGSASVTVTQSTFSLAATTPGNVSKGNSAISTISVSSTTNYSGAVTLTCTLNSGSPTNAAGAPTCTAQTAAVSTGGTGTVSVATKPVISATLERPLLPGRGRGLLDGGSVLALLVLLGIPARRRSWRAILGVLTQAIALGSLAACGGGGGGGSKGGGGGGISDPGTTSGTYTFTVSGIGNDSARTAATTTFTLTVN